MDLAKAEGEEIGREVGRAALLAVVAFACALMLFFLLYIGLWLFIGAAAFGSMGWGVLMGTLLLVGLAVFAGLTAIRVPGLGLMLGVAFLVGAAVTLVAGLTLPNRLWAWIGDVLNLAVESPSRPLAVAALLWGGLGAIIGAVVAYRAKAGAGATIGGFIGGFVIGALAGAFSAISFSWQVAFALGFSTWLLSWPILMGVQTARVGVDEEALKRRFTPQVTIDTTKETIEWAKARMPLGPQS